MTEQGSWQYGIDISEEGEEAEVITGWGTSWGAPEPFTSAEDARSYDDTGRVVKRWVPSRTLGPWIDA